MRSFAVIPAAGHSRRMGRSKLLLPWGERTVIEHVLAVWAASGATRVVIVVRADDEALVAHTAARGADVVRAATPPADMKASIRLGLEHVERAYRPDDGDVWLVAPADMPKLSRDAIARVLEAHGKHPARIIAPRIGNRRGHPVLFPWPLAAEVAALSENEGLNRLVERFPPVEIDVDDDGILADLDTPDDYDRLRP